jgi:predicted RNase H-like HicB family nuclease
MKAVYPVIFTPLDKGHYLVTVPDFPLNTQGKDLSDAIFMARDAIGLMGIAREDGGQALPAPSSLDAVEREPGDIVSLVDVDFDACRRQYEKRTVRRNISIPGWLDDAVTRAGLNVSAFVQAALKRELNLTDR